MLVQGGSGGELVLYLALDASGGSWAREVVTIAIFGSGAQGSPTRTAARPNSNGAVPTARLLPMPSTRRSSRPKAMSPKASPKEISSPGSRSSPRLVARNEAAKQAAQAVASAIRERVWAEARAEDTEEAEQRMKYLVDATLGLVNARCGE